jgi:hypothetical protein
MGPASAPKGKPGRERRTNPLALKQARLAIVAAADELRAASVSVVEADNTFCRAYNARQIALDPWVYDTVRSVSPKTLYNWRAAARAGDEVRLAGSSANNRAGTSCIEIAHDGQVAAFIALLLDQHPHLNNEQIRKLVVAEFGETLEVKRAGGGVKRVALPSVYGFRRYLAPIRKRMREERAKAPTKAQQILGPNAEAILHEVRLAADVIRGTSKAGGA